MTIAGWLILPLLGWLLASKFVNRTTAGFVFDAAFGVLSALIGGFVYSLFGPPGLNMFAVLVMIVGSLLLYAGYHAMPHREGLPVHRLARLVLRNKHTLIQRAGRFAPARSIPCEDATGVWEGEGGAVPLLDRPATPGTTRPLHRPTEPWLKRSSEKIR